MYLFYEDYIHYITIDTDNNIMNNTKEYKLIERKDNTIVTSNRSKGTTIYKTYTYN